MASWGSIRATRNRDLGAGPEVPVAESPGNDCVRVTLRTKIASVRYGANAGSPWSRPLDGRLVMIVLQVRLSLQPGRASQAEELFRGEYSAAIRVQPGFRQAQLLRPYEGHDDYLLVIEFDTEQQRLDWVATAAHGTTWPKFEAMCASISDEGFTVVAAASR